MNRFIVLKLVALVTLVVLSAGIAPAQSLNWEGQTGIFATPLAYTAGSPKENFGKPVVGFHYLNLGNVIGNFTSISVTEGIAKRVEFGYTRTMLATGSNTALSPLWAGGFNIVHGKVDVVEENSFKQKWLPAISGGFVVRQGVQNVSGVLAGNKDVNNADMYFVATKTITQTKVVPILLNFGYKATNASIFGLTGTAPSYVGRMFGAAAFVLKGPAKSTLILATEFAQQPNQIKNLPGASIPTTLTYAVRIVPSEKAHFNVDLGVGQVANHIMPGVDLGIRKQFALGVAYAF
jgi:Protein of unknown function (DUF3034)